MLRRLEMETWIKMIGKLRYNGGNKGRRRYKS